MTTTPITYAYVLLDGRCVNVTPIIGVGKGLWAWERIQNYVSNNWRGKGRTEKEFVDTFGVIENPTHMAHQKKAWSGKPYVARTETKKAPKIETAQDLLAKAEKRLAAAKAELKAAQDGLQAAKEAAKQEATKRSSVATMLATMDAETRALVAQMLAEKEANA